MEGTWFGALLRAAARRRASPAASVRWSRRCGKLSRPTSGTSSGIPAWMAGRLRPFSTLRGWVMRTLRRGVAPDTPADGMDLPIRTASPWRFPSGRCSSGRTGRRRRQPSLHPEDARVHTDPRNNVVIHSYFDASSTSSHDHCIMCATTQDIRPAVTVRLDETSSSRDITFQSITGT
jgi:hypothetical protein